MLAYLFATGIVLLITAVVAKIFTSCFPTITPFCSGSVIYMAAGIIVVDLVAAIGLGSLLRKLPPHGAH